jgi:hypothetical protein
MNAIDQSLNRMPCHTDWRRYDSPTVLRRHGRGFLERTWRSSQLSQTNLEPHPLSGAELKDLAESYGGLCFRSEDKILLLFADYHWARRCQRQLQTRGVNGIRMGCHIQLPGPW